MFGFMLKYINEKHIGSLGETMVPEKEEENTGKKASKQQPPASSFDKVPFFLALP